MEDLKITAYIRRPDGHAFTVYPVKKVEESDLMVCVIGPDNKGYIVSPNNVMFVKEMVPNES